MAEKANAARRAAYDKAAKQFLEGALTAAPPKQPSSARDRIQTENLENVDPRPVGRNVAVAKTFAAKFKAMLDIAGNKDVRYYLNGVHIEDGGRRVATDGARIAIVDGVDVSSAPMKPEKAPGYAYTVLGRDGQWIDGKFVDYMRVWPDLSGQPSFTVDAQKLGDHARGITKASRYTDTGLMKDSGAEGDFRFEEKPDIAFSSKYISDVADLFRRLGYQQIKVTVFESGTGKPVALYSPDGKVKQVIMPRRAAGWGSRVRLSLQQVGRAVELTVCDNGVGQVADVVRKARGGLLGMRERAEMAGGRCWLDEAPGGGLRVHLSLPPAQGQA